MKKLIGFCAMLVMFFYPMSIEAQGTGEIHGWVWVHHGNCTAPWSGETKVFLVNPDDDSFIGQIVHDGYRLEVEPGVYDLCGFSVIEMTPGDFRPFGECREGISIMAGEDVFVGLVLTYPPRTRQESLGITGIDSASTYLPLIVKEE